MSNMANTNNMVPAHHASYMYAPSFEALLDDYLEWFPDDEDSIPLSVMDDFHFWCEFYEKIVPEKYLAEFGALLTALLDNFLEYGEKTDKLSSEKYYELFMLLRAKVIRALVRYDLRSDATLFQPMNLKKDEGAHLKEYLASYAGEDIAKADWDEFSEEVSTLISAAQVFPHSCRPLGRNAINHRLQMMEIPYRILRLDNVYHVVSVEEVHNAD